MITLAAPPAEGFDIVRAEAPALLGEGVFEALGEVEPEIGAPWPVYINTIAKLENGQVIEGAGIKAWQYPLWAGDELLGLAHLSTEPVLQWSALFPPQYATMIWSAVQRAKALSDVQIDPFELRVLEIASVSLHAIWLHGATDLFLPLRSPAFRGDADVPMMEKALVTRFTPIAAMRRRAIGTLGA